jgi:hypothetical protein
MQLKRPTLWSHIRSWEKKASDSPGAFRLATGPLVVVDRDLARTVLLDSESYLESSAFLRTQTYFPLPPDARRVAISGLIRVLGVQPAKSPAELAGFVPVGRWLPNHAWGVQFMRRYFADVLAYRRGSRLEGLIDDFVAGKTIGDDVAGRLFRMPDDVRDALHRDVTAELDRAEVNPTEPRDLVDVVGSLDLDLPGSDRGELYLRLLQSIIGFTGTALEWAVILADKYPEFAAALRSGADCRAFLMEAQRLYPTAWRLLRQARVDHQIGGHEVRPNEDVIIATSTLHRRADYWPDTGQYRPERWQADTVTRDKAFMPFGQGKGMCPGREVAYASIEAALAALFRTYQVDVRLGRWRRPYTRALLAPPRGRVRFRAG